MRNSTKLFLVPLFILFMGLFNHVSAQCEMTSSYGSATVNPLGAVTSISTCSWTEEYSTINGIVAGMDYEFTCTLAGTHKYVTIRDAASGGAVLGHGASPYMYTSSTVTGTVYAHWSDDATCGTTGSCHVTTVQLYPAVSCGDLYAGVLIPTNVSQTVAYASGNIHFWAFEYQDSYVYSFSSCGAGEDTKLRLYDNTGLEILVEDDNGPYCSGTAASMEWTAVGNGVAYISLANYNCDPLSNSGNFEYYFTSCNPPVVNSTTGITQTGATLNWTSSETLFHVKYNMGADFDPSSAGTSVAPDPTTNSVTLTGLTGSTQYYWYIQSDCAGQSSAWDGPFMFNTLCDAFSVPLVETFNSSSTTEFCWTVLNENGDGDQWNMNYTSNTFEGNQVAMMYTDYNSGSNNDYLISPGIILTGNQRLKYSYRVQSSNEPNDFELLLSTTGVSPSDFTTTLLPTTSYSNTSYMQETVNLSAYTGTVYVAWHVPAGGLDGWRIYIDEVIFEEIPSCPWPTALAAAGITDVTAELSWTPGNAETSWDIEIGLDGFTPTGTPTNAGVTNPYTIGGLSALTTYDWYVRADCGGDQSLWEGPHSFTTACSALTIPFTESFDGTTVPNCWSISAASGDGWRFSGTPGYAAAAAGDNTGNGGSFAWIDFSSSDAGVILETPLLDITGTTNPTLAFYFYSHNTNTTHLNFMNVDAWDGAAWVSVASLQVDNGGWTSYSYAVGQYSFNTNFLKLRFRGEEHGNSSDYYNDLLIDDITVYDNNTPPVCATLNMPADLSVDMTTTVDLTWSSSLGAAGYNIYVGTDNPPTDLLNGFDAGNVNSYLASGLAFSTTYYWQIAPYNVIGSATACDIYSFTTMGTPACATNTMPATLSVDLPQDVNLSWDPVTGADGYFLNFGETAPGSCDYTVELIDTYGDGWNGNLLTVYVDGVAVLTDIAIPDDNSYPYENFSESFTFSVANGGVITTSYNIPGSFTYPDENEIYIYDAAGTLIFSDGLAGSDPLATATAGVAACPNTGIDVGNVTSYSQLGLDYSTTYYWQVVPYNGAGSSMGCDVNQLTIMDQPSNNTCDYTVELLDSYGDGWNGGKITVLVGGVPVLTDLTIGYGYGPEIFTFSAYDQGQISVVYTGGSYTSENSYSIYDYDGVMIWEDGAGYNTPSGGIVGIATCPTCDYTVSLEDSYGDSWNGGKMSVFVDGMEVLTDITVASGYGPAVFYFTAYTGAEITTTYTGGSYTYENYYAIFDANGIMLFEDGVGYATPASSAIAGLGDCSLAAPVCTNASSPADGDILVSTTATIDWAAANGVVDGYMLYVGTDNPPTNMLNGMDVGNVLTYAQTLDFFTTYYWQVIPYNVLGVATGCDVYSFITEPDPTVVYPGDDCASAFDYGMINDPAVYSSINYPSDVEWYSFTAPVDFENVSVSLCGSSFDTKLYVYDACGGTQIAYNDDNYSACGPGANSYSEIAFLAAGTYYVKVMGYSSYYGDFVLEILGTEYIPPYNVGVVDIVSPVSGAFFTALHPVTVELANTGLNDITGFEVSYTLDGGTPVVEIYTGTIMAGTSEMFTFAVLADITTGGFHDVVVNVDLLDDYYAIDNSMMITVENFVGCYWSVGLSDSYGDGWNGGYLEVFVNGAHLFADLTLANGLSQMFDIPIYDGDALSVIYHPGQFSTENSYVIYDGFGNAVFTDGLTGTPSPNGYSGTASCAAVVYGCIDPMALNFNPVANVDNGSCEYAGEECMTALNYGVINDPYVMGNNSNTGQMWYTFTLNEDFVNVEVSLCGSMYNTYLEVYDMCGGAVLGSNDDFCGTQSQVDFATLGTGTYYAMVSGSNMETGEYMLEVIGTPVSQTLPQMPWNYELTGGNHTILVPQTASINDAMGNPISNGDYIGVFFNNNGVLACAGYAQWMGVTTSVAAWGDDNQTPEKDGFNAGEEFQWKIWDASTGDIFDATATYLPIPVMPNEQYYSSNGLSGLTALNGFVANYQQIMIPQGWSIMSTYIDPFNPGIDVVFGAIVSDVIIVKGELGASYWPAYGLNLIGNLIVGEGYQIKMENAAVLEVVGIAVVPELVTITLNLPWSLFGYLRTTPMDIDAVISSIGSQIILVKNGVGNIYWPSYSINMIGNMMPGEGYQAKVNDVATFSYPANGPAATAKAEFNYELSYYTDVQNTGSSMTVGLPLSSWESLPSVGDEIAVVSNSGIVLGASVYTGANMAITVWGDDAVTTELEGVSEGENFEFRIWNHNTLSVNSLEISTWLEGSNNYENNGVAVADKVTIDNSLSQSVLHQNVPNPFVDITKISFDLVEDTYATISIYNLLGEKLMEVSARNYSAGQNSVEISAGNLAAGTYLYKISSEEFVSTKTMVIER